MENISFQKRLEQEIGLWLKEGLIAPDQKDNLLARYRVLKEADEKAGPGKLKIEVELI